MADARAGGGEGAEPRLRARSRASRGESFEIVVAGQSRPDLDLDLIAQALVIVARELASKTRKDARD